MKILPKERIEAIKAKIAKKPLQETHIYISYSTVAKLINMIENKS